MYDHILDILYTFRPLGMFSDRFRWIMNGYYVASRHPGADRDCMVFVLLVGWCLVVVGELPIGPNMEHEPERMRTFLY